MIKYKLTAVLTAVTMVTSAAYADPLADMYGKPIRVTSPDGSKSVMQVGLSGTWEIRKPGHAATSGIYYWQSKRTVCFERRDPIPVLNEAGVSCMTATFDAKQNMVTTLTAADGKVTILVVSTSE